MQQEDPAPAGRPDIAARLQRSRTFTSLSLGQFRLLLGGTAFAQVGGWMEMVARGWLVRELTHSPFQLGLVAFIYGIAALVVSPVAGVAADRLDRRLLAGATQLFEAGLALTIGLLVAFDQIAMWQLYLTAAVGGTVFSLNMPARQVLVYDVVGPDNLTNAIALNSVVANVARLAGPSLGGGAIAAAGIAPTFYIEAAFFLLATVATLMLRPTTVALPERVPLWQGVREGFTYVQRDPVILRLVLLNAIPSVLIYPYVGLLPIFAADVLHTGSTGYGLLLTAVGFGSIPGGLIVAGMSNTANKGRVMGVAAVLYMGMVAAFAASEFYGLSFAILIVAGVGWSMMAILNQTLLQLQLTDDALRGRVLAFYSMSNGLTPFGSLAMGTTADRFGVQPAVALFAITAAALAAALSFGSARIRRL
jgi:predicted MFS family arabinose efflux permease